MSPFPSMFEKFLTRESTFLDTLFFEFGHYLSLGSNRCMIGTRYPAGIQSHKACTADKYILNRIVQHVPHVQDTRYIWWRDNYRVRGSLIGG